MNYRKAVLDSKVSDIMDGLKDTLSTTLEYNNFTASVYYATLINQLDNIIDLFVEVAKIEHE